MPKMVKLPPAGTSRTLRRDLAKIAKPTIAEVLAEFLEDQRKRLAPKTFADYRGIVKLFGVVGRVRRQWRLVEAWNVYPSGA